MSEFKFSSLRSAGLACVMVVLVAVCNVVFGGPSESKALEGPEENAALTGELLSTIAYGPKDSQRELSLWKVPMPKLGPGQFVGLQAIEKATRILAGRYAHALLLVDSEQGDPSTGKIVMVHYFREWRAVGPHTRVLSTAAQYSESSKKAYVAMTRSFGGHNVTLKLFEVDLGIVIADFPYIFETRGSRKHGRSRLRPFLRPNSC